MSNLFPSSALPFDVLLEAMGPDPDPIPADPEALTEITAEREQRWAKARRLYGGGGVAAERALALVTEFVRCFGAFHQSSLFRPLADCWNAGNWHDHGFALTLRVLMEEGGHTSALLDELSVNELVQTMSLLPKQSLMTDHELSVLERLPTTTEVFRGGWGATARDVATRGVSWTLSEAVAEGFVDANFASFSSGQWPFHLRASIKKSDILAYFDGEHEVIIDPRAISAWETVGSPMVCKKMSLASEYSEDGGVRLVGDDAMAQP